MAERQHSGGGDSCELPEYAYDQYCDDGNNNEGCNWDGGACCQENPPSGWDNYCTKCECLNGGDDDCKDIWDSKNCKHNNKKCNNEYVYKNCMETCGKCDDGGDDGGDSGGDDGGNSGGDDDVCANLEEMRCKSCAMMDCNTCKDSYGGQ